MRPISRIHLDVLGGIAGDMFVAAILDLHPDLAEKCFHVIGKVLNNERVKLSHTPCNDGIMIGSRFNVSIEGDDIPIDTGNHHNHRHWSDIRAAIIDSDIPESTRQHTLAIFQELAEAEAHCHSVEVDEVSFHEVGAWDSIADIVAAGFLIDSLEATKWTMSTLPTGCGKVPGSHGLLPIPVPAVARLLKGYLFFDDGIGGERITPTGAAILKYLNPSQSSSFGEARLLNCGVGFGTQSLDGVSNILRAVVYEESTSANTFFDNDEVVKLQFDIDDQTPEDLAIGLERIRATQGVIDVLHASAVGKKGRSIMMVQVLAEPDEKNRVIDVCFNETTTLGLRWSIENRLILRRESVETQSEAGVKVARRPSGLSTKMEMDSLEKLGCDHSERERIRALEESAALAKLKKTC